jgi:(R,R)-butanediol dehydrogenase/meso-butanediol dehydrogenase/diacetyl reductase
MKAAVYTALRTIEFQDRPVPKAGPGEVVVKIKYCGICRTDVEIYFEGILPPGIVLGHENVGTVAEIGQGVEGWRVGDRVIAGPPGPCGRCYYCLHGMTSICVDGFEQTNGLRRDGGMAEYMLVRDPGYMLARIPDHVPFEDAVLMDCIATAYHGIQKSDFRMGDNVLVSGAGIIGLCLIQLLKMAGAGHITVLQPSPVKRELALKLGADVAFDPREEGDGLLDKVRALYRGIGADIAFECAASHESFQACLGLLRSGGQLLELGVTETPMTIVPAAIVMRELSLKASLAYDYEDVRECLAYLATGRFRTKGLLSEIIPLSDLVEKGFNRLIVDKSLIKVAVAP